MQIQSAARVTTGAASILFLLAGTALAAGPQSNLVAGKTYLVVVNDGDGEGPIVFRLPSIPKSVRLLGDNRPVPVEGTALRDELPRLMVRLYEIEPASR